MIRVNVTAVMTRAQVCEVVKRLQPGLPSIVSLFAGRIADCGRDPVQEISFALRQTKRVSGCELLWASPREVFNVYQADELGCDIITCTPELLSKLDLHGKELSEHSLDTVKMFYRDAQAARYTL